MLTLIRVWQRLKLLHIKFGFDSLGRTLAGRESDEEEAYHMV